MTKTIAIIEQHHGTALRLLAAAGIGTKFIAGDEITLSDDIAEADIDAALVDLETIAAADQLIDAKANALAVAAQTAADYRRKIAGAVEPGRLVSWATKLAWAMFWAANEGSTDPVTVGMINTAREGFEDEAATTGETAEALRDASLAIEAAKFRAYQVVEGMERLALKRIPAATTQAELEAVVTELRDLEATASAKLDQLVSAAA